MVKMRYIIIPIPEALPTNVKVISLLASSKSKPFIETWKVTGSFEISMGSSGTEGVVHLM